MLKNLKKWFIVDDEEFKDKVSGNSSNDSSIVPEKKTKSTSTLGLTSSPPVPSGKSSPKFTNILLQAMDANNLDGFDYLEYKNNENKLKELYNNRIVKEQENLDNIYLFIFNRGKQSGGNYFHFHFHYLQRLLGFLTIQYFLCSLFKTNLNLLNR